jgi:hypothetical protein
MRKGSQGNTIVEASFHIPSQAWQAKIQEILFHTCSSGFYLLFVSTYGISLQDRRRHTEVQYHDVYHIAHPFPEYANLMNHIGNQETLRNVERETQRKETSQSFRCVHKRRGQCRGKQALGKGRSQMSSASSSLIPSPKSNASPSSLSKV